MPRNRRPTTLAGFPTPSGGEPWPATPWELLRQARDAKGEKKTSARDLLLTRYYKPVHRFFRRVLRARADAAEDVTQDFFARFIENDSLKGITHETSFRNFLKVACRRYYLNWLEARRSRDAGGVVVPLGAGLAAPSEDEFGRAMDEELRADMIAEAIGLLRERLKAKKKEEAFRIFEARVRFDGDAPEEYDALAKKFGLRLYDVRNRLALARKQFREILVDLARQRSGDAEGELRELGLLQYFD